MNRVDRLLGYLLLFQSRDLVRARDLAEQFEISERTVYRDVQALSEVGVPIAAMPGEGYRLLEGYYLPPVMFNPDEARALFLALAMLQGLTEAGPTQMAAGSALAKIRALLPRATRSQVEALQAVVGFYAVGRQPLNLDDDRFGRLQRAIQEHRLVRLRYHALHSNEITSRTVEPYHLAFVNNAWILGGYCHLRQGERNFRLDRIDGLIVRPETFEPRPFDIGHRTVPDQFVRVRVDADAVRWLREAQHFSFVDESEAETGLVMTYQTDNLSQLQNWLLGWGDQIEVLEPAALRAEMAAVARRMARRHED